MKNILVVNVNWVGDVIFSLPIFKALKKSYPDAKIACLAVPRVKEILEGSPYIDEIMIYDEEGIHRTPLSKLALIRTLRQKKFDIAFILHKSLTRALFAFLAGIPRRVGYDAKGRGFLLTHRVKPISDPVHRSDYYINVIESFGIKVEDRVCEFVVREDSRKIVEELLKKEGVRKDDFLVVISAGGNWDLKRWPKENFALLIDRLADELKAKVAIVGAQKDVALVNSIEEKVRAKPITLTGQTNLKELGALLERANLFISADTGPLHLASSVGTNVVGLFGPTRPEMTGPRGKGHAIVIQNDVGCNRTPCYHLTCPDNVCMRSITVEQVIHEIRQLKN